MKGRKQGNGRGRKGQVFIEVLCGLIMLVFMGLFALDVVVLVLANSANDTLAKNCARAAANTQSKAAAQEAAQQVVAAFPVNSAYIEKVGFLGSKLAYDKNETVRTETVLVVKLPITLPGTVEKVAFHAAAVEPVVGVSGAPDSDAPLFANVPNNPVPNNPVPDQALPPNPFNGGPNSPFRI